MKYYIVLVVLLCSSVTITAQKDVDSDSNFKNSIKEGALIYEDFCVNWHLPNGKGVEKTFPPLAKSDYLMNERELSIKAIKFGQKGDIVVNGITYNNIMVPMGLTDEEIADVMNYITNSWGNKNKKMITVEEVSKIEL